MPLNYDAVGALTRRKYIPQLVDNFFNSHPFLALIREKNYKPWSGQSIVQPIIYGELSSVHSYRGYDTLTYDQNFPVTAAEFPWKHYSVNIAIPRTDEIENAGEAQVISTIQAKFKDAELSLQKKFALDLYSDGTGNSNKDVDGLGIAVSDTGVYGRIDRAAYPWWRAKVYANGGQARPLTTRLMRQVYLSVSDGRDKPSLILTTKALWNRYAEIVEGTVQVQTQAGQKLASLGFQTLEFMGTPVVWDNDCPAGTMWFLNLEYLGLRYSPLANFTPTKLRQADMGHVYKQEILWSGNLVCSNCRRQAKLTDLDETGY